MSQPQRLEPQYEDPFRYPSAPCPLPTPANLTSPPL